jgi:hypothetical protein
MVMEGATFPRTAEPFWRTGWPWDGGAGDLWVAGMEPSFCLATNGLQDPFLTKNTWLV